MAEGTRRQMSTSIGEDAPGATPDVAQAALTAGPGSAAGSEAAAGQDAAAGQAAASAPARPPLQNPNSPPVLAKLTPPFSVRVSQLFWVLSFVVGGFAVVYFFVIRRHQLPLIQERVALVDPDRAERTYAVAADILYWSVFSIWVTILLVQITLLVSFMARRPNVRWWQLLTLAVQAVVFVLALDLALTGTRAEPLHIIVAAQCALVLLALLCAVLPPAMAWSARRQDVVRHQRDDASLAT